jgi:hypothetical protein
MNSTKLAQFLVLFLQANCKVAGQMYIPAVRHAITAMGIKANNNQIAAYSVSEETAHPKNGTGLSLK